MNALLFLIPIISAGIGWLLSSAALKVVAQPKRIRTLTARLIAELKNEFSSSDLQKIIGHPDNMERLMPVLEMHIDVFLREKLTTQIPMLSMVIGDKTVGMVKAVFLEELRQLFPVVMEQYFHSLIQEAEAESVLSVTLHKISPEKLKQIFTHILSPQQLIVKIGGAVLGFTIGVLQVLLTLATA